MIYIDFETRSEVDIKKSGAWVYSLHPSTEILCLSYKMNNEPVLLADDLTTCVKFRNYLFENPEALVEAHNAFFEKAIWQNIMVKRYGWPEIKPEQWRCSASVAAYHALPRSLSGAGKILNLSTVKDDEGKRVMLQLAKPKPRTGGFFEQGEYPEKFQTLYKYCKSDVEAEYAITKKLGQLPQRELNIWQLDQKINTHGVPVDLEAITAALKILDEYKIKLEKELETITEGEIKTVGQRDKILDWCNQRGEKLSGLTKSDVVAALQVVKHPEVKRILEIRQSLSKTSTAKYEAMKNSTAPDSRIRDVLMYHGASTGRWSGKLVQFQNLPRGNIKDMETAIKLIKKGSLTAVELLEDDVMSFMSSAIRGMVCAPEKHTLLVADFAAIEARVLAWLANSKLMLKHFRTGKDLYKDMASQIYKVPINEVTPEQRQLGKAAILGAGYGMGSVKFYETCLSWGLAIDKNLAVRAIQTYRDTYSEIPNLWRNVEQAAMAAVSRQTQVKIGNLAFFMQDNFLKCKLPSGRLLHYYKPKIEKIDKEGWGQLNQLTYLAEKTGKVLSNVTYGGKLVENITQAVARDIMANSMIHLDKLGYQIILTIHDEIIAEIEETDACHKLDTFCQKMALPPSWALDCPVSVEGWQGKHYRK
jgi:DNA polymerase